MKSILILFLSVVSSGCVIGFRDYVQPTEGPMATIKFVNKGTGNGSAEIFREAETCKDRYLNPGIKAGESLELKVKANQKLSFHFWYFIGYNVSSYSTCGNPITFFPEEGKYYQAELSYSPGGCFFILNEISSGKTSQVPYEKREWIRGWGEDLSWCK
jgi:hypothetical protein